MALQLWRRSKIISRKNVAYSLDSLHPMPGPWVDKSSSISRVTYTLVLFDWLVSAKGHLWFLCSETPLHIYVLQSPTECDKCFLMKKEEPQKFRDIFISQLQNCYLLQILKLCCKDGLWNQMYSNISCKKQLFTFTQNTIEIKTALREKFEMLNASSNFKFILAPPLISFTQMDCAFRKIRVRFGLERCGREINLYL